jgi:hypothetical protein
MYVLILASAYSIAVLARHRHVCICNLMSMTSE